MTVHALVSLKSPASKHHPDIGDFDFIALPRVGELITITTKTMKGVSQTSAYRVLLVEHFAETAVAPEATLWVEEE
jgi:hypothetical protein